MPAKHVTDAAFETTVLQADQPVLVDFWAPWCGPCRQIAPALDELADELAGTLDIVKINIDDNPDAATRHNVRSIPTMILFNKGEVVATAAGARPKGAIKSWIGDHIS